MAEPAPKTEMPKPPVPEAKPAATPPAPKEESTTTSAPATAPAGTARNTLEAIAAGKPVAEATKPAEKLPDKETVTGLLAEGNKILLELRDMRLLVNSLVTYAGADTPLATEVRMDALRGLLNVESAGLPPEQAAQITQLQEKIKALNLPEPNPATSATLDLINRYNTEHAATAIPESVVNDIRIGKREAATTVSQLLQTNDDLSGMTWKELTGADGFTRLAPTPEQILDLAGIPQTPENLKKAQETFGIIKGAKEPGATIGEQVVMGVMYGALGLQFFSSIALGEQGGGH